MKPKRPDSAKTHQTKKTQDSDEIQKDLTSSKFSETFSSGVNSFHEKPDDFRQYVAEKDKDPKFKHLKKLETIPEKNQNETAKSFKPFEKKKDKTIEKGKIQEKQKEEKPQEQLSLSRGFAEKNKQKMNSLKVPNPLEQEKIKQITKAKLNFDAFKVNKPGEKKETKRSEPKKQQKQQREEQPALKQAIGRKSQLKTEAKTEQELAREKREQEYQNIERFVNEVQARNIASFPANYDQVVTRRFTSGVEDLQKIDLNDFLDQPTQGDMQMLRANILKMDHRLDSEKIEESIDLEDILVNNSQAEERQKEQDDYEDEIYASLSADQIRKRNAFITEVMMGKLNSDKIAQLEEMNRTSMKMYKIEKEKEEQYEVQLPQINMVKRQSNRLIERNKIEANGQLYRDCDYLSEEHKKRLEQLLNGDIGPSPFDCDELQKIQRRSIDEGIRMYRQLAGDQEGEQILNEVTLPKDPKLRKQAEEKVLKEKMSRVNERLSQVGKVVVTKTKIEALIKKFAYTRNSANYEQIYTNIQAKFNDEFKKIEQAEELAKNLSEKENMEEIMNEIELQYRELQEQIWQFAQIDEKQLEEMERGRLKRKLAELQQIQRLNNELNGEISEMEKLKQEVKRQLLIYDQIEQLATTAITCDGFSESETLEDIDAMITRKMEKSQAQIAQ